ncbi:MAG: NADH-quinone oxidoreductase subunit C [Deltaproteobacteria bacterium]|uniref:NADH-quinone oxidoreductase subunit C n=1 Tax=Candidatus Desulfacyla euxinica TaxID=2841693 RepID=A0A8J6N272_9DELT|nr:NADH-quinone oxidoreductase subunit C [Candidatus Desulfacyla euxinica]
MKKKGYRLVTLSCVELDADTLDILYHFDKDLDLMHLRLTAPKNKAVPSISSVYFASFLVENEIQDQFGIRFEGLVLDYDRTLYLEEEVRDAPCCRIAVSEEEKNKGE